MTVCLVHHAMCGQTTSIKQTVNLFPAVAVFLLVNNSVKPRWAQSHSSITQVEGRSAAAVEPPVIYTDW